MKTRATFIYFMTLIISLLALSCNPRNIPAQYSSTLPTGNTQTATVQPPSTTEPVRIMRDLDISSPPKLGETTELTFTVSVKELWEGEWEGRLVDDLAQAKAWVEFTYADIHGSYSAAKYSVQVPLSEVAANDLVWEGNALENREITLISNFQIPNEGIWRITGYFSTANWTKPLERSTPFAVVDGTATLMYANELSNSSLAYLGAFSYGELKPKQIDERIYPVIIELDISKPPLAGEEATLTTRITSLHDENNFSASVRFLKNQSSVDRPLSNFLVSGDLGWKGNLKAQTPVEFSAVIKFPEEGEWRIIAEGNTTEREASQQSAFTDGIAITITPDKSYYGWLEKSVIPTSLPTNMPTVNPT